MTLDHHRWDRRVPCDPSLRTHAEVEWAVDAGCVAVTALLVRELGVHSAAGDVFGDLVGRVTAGREYVEGPNTVWSALLLQAMRDAGYRTDPSDPLNTTEWLDRVEVLEREHAEEWRRSGRSGRPPPLPWNGV
eukprot:TRINITY_DN22186_c0_g1_i3.p3 TRINITY_DN22186_c0_g1~~TRINITY_DN22186_c0_g1_i3.p3  ORF type:complete len:133 (+),score=21.80 TRINITY_DN22186_c0_g1_i3:758-1156(+)